MKKIYFVRHGETEGNVGRFFQSSDTPLTDKGHEGAKALAARFSKIPLDAIFVSPFVRTQQTAKYISELKGISPETVTSLHEFLQSVSIRGKEWASPEGQEYNKERKNNFFNPEWGRDGAENHAKVIKRIKEAVAYIESHPAQNIVVVSHGQFLGLLTTYLLLGKSADSSTNETLYENLHLLSNVAITEFIYNEGKWQLFTFNDHAHFADN
jgi:broad specificity phosphatase PhoE